MQSVTIPARVFVVLVLMSGFGLPVASAVQGQSYDVPPRPEEPVLDRAEMLSGRGEDRLARQLPALTDSASTPIAVVTVSALDGAPIADYAEALARAWGLNDDGVVLLVSKRDRQVTIAPGTDVEDDLPDALTTRIVRRVIEPTFLRTGMYDGLAAGTDAIYRAIQGRSLNWERLSPSSEKHDPPITLEGIVFFLTIVAMIFLGMLRVYLAGGGGGGTSGIPIADEGIGEDDFGGDV